MENEGIGGDYNTLVGSFILSGDAFTTPKLYCSALKVPCSVLRLPFIVPRMPFTVP